MRRRGASVIVPRRSADERRRMKLVPLLGLSSTYVRRAVDALPKAGDRAPWSRRSSYFRDMLDVKWGSVRAGLEWS
ncbi:hypothetical protein CDD83_1900 [Cordyceps sp. RAO-2017]|nr:hypothetical protein CDD83_1900 [Cordyceps sp. RAO-2017]